MLYAEELQIEDESADQLSFTRFEKRLLIACVAIVSLAAVGAYTVLSWIVGVVS